MNKLFVLYGKSASGKTTIEKMLRNAGFQHLISYTTRAKRDGEIDGHDYYFVSAKEFNEIDFAATYKLSDNWMYGVKEKNLEGVNIFSVISAPYINDLSKVVDVSIIYLDIPREIRLKRLLERGESESSITKRFEVEDSEMNIDLSDFSSLLVIEDGNIDEIYDKISKFINLEIENENI